jgi:hypothetical protein
MSDLNPVKRMQTNSSELSSTWFFIKVTLGVIVGLALLVVVLSPRLYSGINEDSPEYYQKKAKEYVEQKKYQKAIEAYNSVLEYEPDPRKIFVTARQQIKRLQSIQASREAAAGEETPTAEEPEPAATETEPAPPAEETEDEPPAEDESTVDEDTSTEPDRSTPEDEGEDMEESGASPLDDSLIP